MRIFVISKRTLIFIALGIIALIIAIIAFTSAGASTAFNVTNNLPGYSVERSDQSASINFDAASENSDSKILTYITSDTKNSWGLYYREANKIPEAPFSKEYLAAYNAYFVGDENQKKLYLTFDAGYENGYTPAILDALKKHGARAVFFLCGNYFDTSPEIVRRMVAEGHLIGNHSEKHLDSTRISHEKLFSDLKILEDKYQEVTGQPMAKVYRPPEGHFNEDVLKTVSESGYKTIFWSVTYADWDNNNQPSHEKALTTLAKRIHPGAIVLLHATSKTNSEILDEFLTACENSGYTFPLLNELWSGNEQQKPMRIQ